jgi:branched-chain amino acid transport system substrate-binding protein
MALSACFPSRRILLLLLIAAGFASSAHAQTSTDAVRIAVLNDQSGVYADFGGPGAVVAARMAVEDQRETVLGRPIEVLVGDHQGKPDIGVAIARQWFDSDNVGMVIGFDNSSVALAVEQLAAQKNRIAIAGAVATTDFTGKACTPNEAAWVYDSYALTTSLASALVRQGQDTWFFVTVDYAFGNSMQSDATNAVLANGGKVLGSVRHPLNNSDFSSYLLQAQASGAKVIALANAGGDMINATKQAKEFGLTGHGQSVVALLAFLTDIHSIGLEAAQGLKFVTPFYWDRDDDSRAWSRRFFERHKSMPTMGQAGVYSAVRHYLRAVATAGTVEAGAVMTKMRELPVNDFFARGGHVRVDGRLVHDMYFVQVKTPAEAKGPWDYYKVLETIPGEKAFRPLDQGGCPLAKRQ